MKIRIPLLVLLFLTSLGASAGMAEKVTRLRIGGADVIAYPTAIQDVVTIVGSLPAGDAFAGADNPAVPTLAGMMLDKGTTRADKFAIARQLESVGAAISFSVSEQTLDIRAKCLRADLPLVLRLMVEQLRTPAFSADEFEKVRKQLAGMLTRAKEDTDFRATEAFLRAVYPAGHPNRTPTVDEMLAAISRTQLADLKSFHAQHYGPAHLTLAIVGDFDVKTVRSQLQQDLRGWSGGREVIGAPVPATARASSETIQMPDKTSVSVVIGQPSGIRYRDDDALALRMATAILGSGFTGRLMKTVRDGEGLTYGIGAYLDNDVYADGDWRIVASFAPELTEQGVGSTRRELMRWWQDGVTAEELAARKADLVGSYKVGLATTGGLAGFLLRTVQRGKPLSWLDDYPKALNALTLEQVNGAIRRHLDPARMVVVEAGTLPDGG
jgi:zinc protease